VQRSKGADVDILLLDLRTLESVRKCAADFKSHNLPLHLLVNNAGVALGTPWYTSEGVGGSAQVHMAVFPISWTLPACHPGCCCSDLYMSPLLRQPFISSALFLTFKNPKGINFLW
jgi:NAD(P)-dependent dehydrogenase (short-subunit alcohol dehydrogenase family)